MVSFLIANDNPCLFVLLIVVLALSVLCVQHVVNRTPLEVIMSIDVCLQKDIKKFCDITNLEVLIVLVNY